MKGNKAIQSSEGMKKGLHLLVEKREGNYLKNKLKYKFAFIIVGVIINSIFKEINYSE